MRLRRQLRRNQIAMSSRSHRVCPCYWPVTRRPTRGERKQQYHIARTTKPGGSIGVKRGTDDDLTELVGELTRTARGAFRSSSRTAGCEGKREDGSHDIKWLTPGGDGDGRGGLEFCRGAFRRLYVLAPLGRSEGRRSTSCSTPCMIRSSSNSPNGAGSGAGAVCLTPAVMACRPKRRSSSGCTLRNSASWRSRASHEGYVGPDDHGGWRHLPPLGAGREDGHASVGWQVAADDGRRRRPCRDHRGCARGCALSVRDRRRTPNP